MVGPVHLVKVGAFGTRYGPIPEASAQAQVGQGWDTSAHITITFSSDTKTTVGRRLLGTKTDILSIVNSSFQLGTAAK